MEPHCAKFEACNSEEKLSNVETSKSQLSLTTSWVLQTEWICFPWGTSTSNAGSNCSNTVHHLVVLQMQRIIQECFISHVHLWVEPVQHYRHAETVKQRVRKDCALCLCMYTHHCPSSTVLYSSVLYFMCTGPVPRVAQVAQSMISVHTVIFYNC